MEAGRIIRIDWFTGPSIEMPWWNDTRAVYIEGETGVFNYGEIQELPTLKVGDTVKEGEYIGHVLTVLKKPKGRPMSMLHVELYDHGFTDTWGEWKIGDIKPIHLLCPEEYLLQFGSYPCYIDPYEESARIWKGE
jgi:hypothetical protein